MAHNLRIDVRSVRHNVNMVFLKAKMLILCYKSGRQVTTNFNRWHAIYLNYFFWYA